MKASMVSFEGWFSGSIVSFRGFHFQFDDMRWLLRSIRTSQCWVHHWESAAMLMQHKGLRRQNLGLFRLICLPLWVRDAGYDLTRWVHSIHLHHFTCGKNVASASATFAVTQCGTERTLWNHPVRKKLQCYRRLWSATGDFQDSQSSSFAGLTGSLSESFIALAALHPSGSTMLREVLATNAGHAYILECAFLQGQTTQKPTSQKKSQIGALGTSGWR